MSLDVINDTHLGAIRSGGTTPITQVQLRQQTLEAFVSLLALCKGDVLINGDLFDAFMVPFIDLWATVNAISAYLGRHPNWHVYAARGNHDIAKNTLNMSTFDLFCKIMQAMHPGRFWAITEPTSLKKEHDAYVIPHMPNQDLFNEALKAAPPAKFLFVHANYDNRFAVEADHSLNVTPEQAAAARSDFIIFGHEHQRRTELKGKVVVVGNQIPTSVADCLGNDAKYMLRIEGTKIEHLPVWKAEDDFLRVDWKALREQYMTTVPRMVVATAKQRFIRVQGDATAVEAVDVISLISKLRSASKALVITNAVAIDGVTNEQDIKMSLESVKSFDVLTALLDLLDEGWERDTVKSLVEKHNVQTTEAD